MSPVIEITKRELNFGKVVDPAWYRVKINEVGEGQSSKDKKSTNYLLEGEILFNGDTGDTTFAGVGLSGFTWMFNSKMMGPAVGLIKCISDEPINEGSRIELKAAEGCEVDVYVENKVWEGNLRNSVNHKYRKPKTDVVALVK